MLLSTSKHIKSLYQHTTNTFKNTQMLVKRPPKEAFVDIAGKAKLALLNMVLTLWLKHARALLPHESAAPSSPCPDHTCMGQVVGVHERLRRPHVILRGA